MFGKGSSSARAETMAYIDALRASGRPFAYHVMTDADRRDADTFEPRADVGSALGDWMRDSGLR